MIRICVDIGNSRLKSAIDDGNSLQAIETFAWHDVFLNEVLDKLWLSALNGRVPTSIHVSNVAGDKLLPNLDAWCCATWGLRAIPMRSRASFKGLVNGYQEPGKLGVDRWAALIGARELYKGPLCVIDSGTATTVDVINADGVFVGGAILPGIYTMRRSLAKYTAALFAADGQIMPFGDNTASGIAGGTGYALVGGVERLIQEAENLLGSVTTVVTGGEANVLKSLITKELELNPMLVLHGVKADADALDIEALEDNSRCSPELLAQRYPK